MPETIEFNTTRLRLRQWTDEDREPFAAMNADPDVMKYFAGVETREGSNRIIDIWRAELAERGWSNWAVERMDSAPSSDSSDCPCRAALHCRSCPV